MDFNVLKSKGLKPKKHRQGSLPMIMSSKYPTTASNSASEAEELKNTPGLGAVSDNSSFFQNVLWTFSNELPIN